MDNKNEEIFTEEDVFVEKNASETLADERDIPAATTPETDDRSGSTQSAGSPSSESSSGSSSSEEPTTFARKPFYQHTSTTIAEVFSFHNYSRLDLAPAVLLGIALSPFLVSVIVLSAAFYVLLFVYKMLVAPADYLISSMKTDHDSVWIQLVIYILGYPVVLAFRFAGALIGIGFFFINFLINCFGYVYSLGGIHFHAFLYDDVREQKPLSTQRYGKAENIIALVVALVLILTSILSFVIPAIANNVSHNNSENNYNPTIDYATNTTMSSADSMSAYSNRSYNVKNGDTIWIKTSVPANSDLDVNVYSSDTTSVYMYLYRSNASYYELSNSGYSSVMLSIPTRSYTTSYYVKIVCNFLSGWGTISVSIQ